MTKQLLKLKELKTLYKVNQLVLKKLTKNAIEAQKLSYAPYSKYHVGAAVLCKGDEIFTGANIENVNYTLTNHAEENAIINAVINGMIKKHSRRFIKAILIVHDSNGPPCGSCRQTIQEFCDDCVVININKSSKILQTHLLSEILPFAFTPSNLGIK